MMKVFAYLFTELFSTVVSSTGRVLPLSIMCFISLITKPTKGSMGLHRKVNRTMARYHTEYDADKQFRQILSAEEKRYLSNRFVGLIKVET